MSDMTVPDRLLLYVAVEDCVPAVLNRTRDITPENVAELADSIRLYGVLQPVVVCPNPRPDKNPARYMIVAGCRRHKAALIAGLKTIPATLREGDGGLALAMISLTENIQRQQLNPIQEAQCFRALMEQRVTQDMIAQRISKSQVYVSNTVRLLLLPPAVREQIAIGELSRSQGKTLLMKQYRGHEEEIAAQVRTENITVRQLERGNVAPVENGARPPALPAAVATVVANLRPVAPPPALPTVTSPDLEHPEPTKVLCAVLGLLQQILPRCQPVTGEIEAVMREIETALFILRGGK